MEALGVAANAIAVVDLSFNVGQLCVEYYQGVSNAADEIQRVHNQVLDLGKAVGGVQKLLAGIPSDKRLEVSNQFTAPINDAKLQLEKLELGLQLKPSRKFFASFNTQFLKWPFQRKDVDRIVEDLERCKRTIMLALQVDQTFILLDIDQKLVLERLPIAEGAAFDSHAEEHNSICLPNTRVDLRAQVLKWAADPDAEAVFWLNGMAGTGKSTVARTIARALANNGSLGASFIFKRGETDRGSLAKFFTTIAADLIVREPAIARFVNDVIDNDPFVVGKAGRHQFDKLIQGPVSKVRAAGITKNKNTIVFVIDALDECGQQEDIELLIGLFSRANNPRSPHLKFFLTSRPEVPIRLGFQKMTGQYQSVVLHEISEPIIEHDISAFMEHELAKVRDDHRLLAGEAHHLAPDWPGKTNFQILVKMAVPLFIFAATICRFIGDPKYGNPDEQLQEVLLFQTKSQESSTQLDATYLPVLQKLVHGLTGKHKAKAIKLFRDVVGPIILLENPLSTTALAQIIDMPISTINGRLNMLHSVLDIPESTESPVNLLHLSFRDFLVDIEKRETNEFWIDEKHTHGVLAEGCLRLLDRRLKQDLCDVKAPGTPLSSIDSVTINKGLPLQVHYACLYWTCHVCASRAEITDGGQIHTFLKRHFLHWLEALCLLGKVPHSALQIKTLQLLINPQCSPELSAFLADAIRFIQADIVTMGRFPLQIYSSFLAFTPINSTIRKIFEDQIAHWISIEPEVASFGAKHVQTLSSNGRFVAAVVFSHDSSLIALSEGKIVRLWRTNTYECILTLEGHHRGVRSLAFSYDSSMLASASKDRTVKIWQTDAGDCIQTLTGHICGVLAVAFSHGSSELVASAEQNGSIRIWRTATWECIKVLDGHPDLVTSVSFSRDSTFLALSSAYGTVQTWRMGTWESLKTLGERRPHEESVHACISPDSTLLATASGLYIAIRSVESGECLRVISAHNIMFRNALREISDRHELFRQVAFSHDSKRVTSGVKGHLVCIWSVDTGECLQSLTGHGDWVGPVAFSHDSTLVASASVDNTVRIWQVEQYLNQQEKKPEKKQEKKQEKKKHVDSSPWLGSKRERIKQFIFSADGTILASISDYGKISIWDTITASRIRTIDASNSVLSSNIAMSRDSALIASYGFGGIQLWRVDSGERIKALATGSFVYLAVLSYDSSLIVAAIEDSFIRIWSTQTGQIIQEFQPFDPVRISAVAISHDSELVAFSDSPEYIITVQRVATGDHVRFLDGHTTVVRVIAFDTSSVLASSSADMYIRIWNINTAHCLQIIDYGNLMLSHLSFCSDGRRLSTDVGYFCLAPEVQRVMLATNVESKGDEIEMESMGRVQISQQEQVEEDVGILTCSPGLSIDSGKRWIKWNGENVFRIPVEHELSSCAVLEYRVALGCVSGDVFIIGFAIQELDDIVTYSKVV